MKIREFIKIKKIKSALKTSDKFVPLASLGIVVLLCTSIYGLYYATNIKEISAIDNAYEVLDSNLIYDGIFIEEVNISGLTKEQAVLRGENSYAKPRLERKFTFTSGKFSKDLTYEQLGGSYNIKQTVDEAYKIGRSGSKASRLEITSAISNKKQYLVSNLSIDKNKMKSTLKELSNQLKEETGKEIDINLMVPSIENSMLIGDKDIVFDISIK